MKLLKFGLLNTVVYEKKNGKQDRVGLVSK